MNSYLYTPKDTTYEEFIKAKEEKMSVVRSTMLICSTALICAAVFVAYNHYINRYEIMNVTTGVFILDRQSESLSFCNNDQCSVIYLKGQSLVHQQAVPTVTNSTPNNFVQAGVVHGQTQPFAQASQDLASQQKLAQQETVIQQQQQALQQQQTYLQQLAQAAQQQQASAQENTNEEQSEG